MKIDLIVVKIDLIFLEDQSPRHLLGTTMNHEGVVIRFDMSTDPKPKRDIQIWAVDPRVIRSYDETSSSAMPTVPRVEFQVMSINKPLALMDVM